MDYYEKEAIRLEAENIQLKERITFLEKLALSEKTSKQDKWFTGPITTYPVPEKPFGPTTFSCK